MSHPVPGRDYHNESEEYFFPTANEQRYNDPVHGVIRPCDIYGHSPRGITIRDYIAVKAMQGLLSAPSDCTSSDSGPNARANPSMCAEWAYQFADAMLKSKYKN